MFRLVFHVNTTHTMVVQKDNPAISFLVGGHSCFGHRNERCAESGTFRITDLQVLIYGKLEP